VVFFEWCLSFENRTSSYPKFVDSYLQCWKRPRYTRWCF